MPAVTGAAGIAGGILLGRNTRGRKGKRPAIQMPNIQFPKKIDLTGVGEHIGEAGRQFGKLAGEVRNVREAAERIGKALS